MVTPHQVLSGSLRPRAQRSRFMMTKFAKVCAASTIAFVYSNAYPGNFVTGASSNANFTLNTAANWQTIRLARKTIPATDAAIHDCVATVSADVLNPGLQGRENQYLFALTLNNSNPPVDNNTNTPGASPTERMVEITDNGTVNDPNSVPVATTGRFLNLTRTNGQGGTGTHTGKFDMLRALLSIVDAGIEG